MCNIITAKLTQSESFWQAEWLVKDRESREFPRPGNISLLACMRKGEEKWLVNDLSAWLRLLVSVRVFDDYGGSSSLNRYNASD